VSAALVVLATCSVAYPWEKAGIDFLGMTGSGRSHVVSGEAPSESRRSWCR